MANIVAQPMKWRNKTMLVKSEGATYGVDSTPTAAVNWIEARNVSLTPMDTDKVARNIELPYMGNAGNINVGFWAKVSFDVAMAPSGTAGTAPKWGPLMLGCGTAETITPTTSVAYNLVSSAFGSVCAYIYIEGILHKMLGMRGDVKGKISAKGTPMLSFSFDALYVTPVSATPSAITRTGWAIEEGVNSANTLPVTINSVALAFSSLEWAFGQKVSRVDLPGPQREIVIGDRSATASITVLAPGLGTFNPFALAESGVIVPLTTTHGSAAGKKVKNDLQVRILNVEYDQIEGMVAHKLTLEPAPVAGNDEIALTCL